MSDPARLRGEVVAVTDDGLHFPVGRHIAGPMPIRGRRLSASNLIRSSKKVIRSEAVLYPIAGASEPLSLILIAPHSSRSCFKNG